MATIITTKEFKNDYGQKLGKYFQEKIMSLKPGESYVVGFQKEDVFFVRVTEFHIATMSVYEFNGIE